MNHSLTDPEKSSDPLVSNPAVPDPDPKRGQKPALSQPPYKPYAKATLPEPPYEPYKNM